MLLRKINSKLDSGRSLLEMLMVMAIVATLTAAVIRMGSKSDKKTKRMLLINTAGELEDKIKTLFWGKSLYTDLGTDQAFTINSYLSGAGIDDGLLTDPWRKPFAIYADTASSNKYYVVAVNLSAEDCRWYITQIADNTKIVQIGTYLKGSKDGDTFSSDIVGGGFCNTTSSDDDIKVNVYYR